MFECIFFPDSLFNHNYIVLHTLILQSTDNLTFIQTKQSNLKHILKVDRSSKVFTVMCSIYFVSHS